MLLNFRNTILLYGKRAVMVPLLVTVGSSFLASGCALAESPGKLMSHFSEAKTRQEIARLAKNDPFPTVAEVGH